MKLNKRLLIPVLTICIVLTASCGRSNNGVYYQEADYSQADTISFDYTQYENEISRDDLFGDIRYIPLETNDRNLIGIIDQVILCDSTIIVADLYISKAVFMFDYNGKYIGRISNYGNGHHEYRDLSYVCKRPDNAIVIVDEINQQLMVYNERGEFIESIFNDTYVNAVEYINMELSVFDVQHRYCPPYDYSNRAFAIKHSNMEDKYIFGKNDHEPSFTFLRNYSLYSYDGKVYCNLNFEDCIYEIVPDSVKAKYVIEFGPENVIHHPYKTNDDYIELKKFYPFFAGEFVELKDYSYICFRGEEGRELIYDHATKTTYALISGFNRPMTAFFRRPIARQGDNTMVCALTATEIFLSQGVLAGKPETDELYSKITIDSNPVLFFYDVSLK